MLKLVRTTVTGALVFVLPVGIIAIFVGKIITSARGLLEPLSEQLPVKSVAGVSAAILVALFAIIFVSFLSGLLARSRMASNVVQQMETHLLGRIPAYGLLKSLSNDVIAPDEEVEHPVVLVRADDAWQLGIKIAPTAEGQHSVVFISDSPTPQSGAVVIVENSRLQVTEISLAKAFSALSARGMGLAELLRIKPVQEQ